MAPYIKSLVIGRGTFCNICEAIFFGPGIAFGSQGKAYYSVHNLRLGRNPVRISELSKLRSFGSFTTYKSYILRNRGAHSFRRSDPLSSRCRKHHFGAECCPSNAVCSYEPGTNQCISSEENLDVMLSFQTRKIKRKQRYKRSNRK